MKLGLRTFCGLRTDRSRQLTANSAEVSPNEPEERITTSVDERYRTRRPDRRCVRHSGLYAGGAW